MSIMNTLSNLWEQTAFMNLDWGNYVMDPGCAGIPVSGNQTRI